MRILILPRLFSTERSRPSVGVRFKARAGFSLVEIMVSTSIMVFILIAIASLTGMISTSFRRSMGRSDAFESARVAFDSMARNLKQATLQSYLGYDNPLHPSAYQLKSELHFATGKQAALGLPEMDSDDSHAIFFQAPTGRSGVASRAKALLASSGYFIGHTGDPLRPPFLSGRVADRKRYRLYQLIEPREKMGVYQRTITLNQTIPISNDSYQGYTWFSDTIDDWNAASDKAGYPVHFLAENVIGLIIWSVANGQRRAGWNSRAASIPATLHRLPQALEVVLVAIDEESAMRLEEEGTPNLLEGLFNAPANHETDLATLEARLSGRGLNYRVYQTTIPLDAANTH